MDVDAPAAMLDPKVLENVARLAVAALTPPKRRNRTRHVNPIGTDPTVDAGTVVTSPNHGVGRITEGDLSKAIEAALHAIVDRGELVVLGGGGFAADPMIRKLVERLPSIIAARRRTLTEKHIEALVDAYLPADALASVMPDIEADNAKAQADFLRAYPTLTADQVAERAGHGAANRSATANRWKAEQKIFAVRAGGREVYPAFQFKDGRPRPSLRPALKALATRSGWQTAFWFVTPNSWLGGPAPIDRLDDGEALAGAAAHEAEAWVG